MKLELKRDTLTPNSTIGTLSVNSVFECYTLERPHGDPLEIPAGSYTITLWDSPKFGRLVPRLNSPAIADRDPIEIHYGNTAANSHGCILVGHDKSVDFIGNSRLAFGLLFAKIAQAIPEGVTLDILDAS